MRYPPCGTSFYRRVPCGCHSPAFRAGIQSFAATRIPGRALGDDEDAEIITRSETCARIFYPPSLVPLVDDPQPLEGKELIHLLDGLRFGRDQGGEPAGGDHLGVFLAVGAHA